MSARGWRETVEPGIARAHSTTCKASETRERGRRCKCPWHLVTPGVGARVRTSVTFTGTLTEARAHRRRQMLEGRPTGPVDSGDIRGHAARWFKAGAPHWSPKTLETRDRYYRAHIDPMFGTSNPASIRTQDIEPWVLRLLATGNGRRAVELTWETLRALLGWLVDQRVITTNPARGVRLPQRPPESKPAERVLDRDQTTLLLDTCKRIEHRTILRAAVEAGLRRGEIAGLRWTDVDLPGLRLNIRRAIVQTARTGKVERRPKMGKTGRVAITQTLADLLSEQHLAHMVRGLPADGFVWPGRTGGSMSPSSVTQLVGRLRTRAGLIDEHGQGLIHLHGLRHTAASAAIARGVPVTVVSAQLRHSRPDTTMRVYAHLLDDGELDRFTAQESPEPEKARERAREQPTGNEKRPAQKQ